MEWLVEHLKADESDTPASLTLDFDGEPARVCYSEIIEADSWYEARVRFVFRHCVGLDPYDPRFRCTRVK